MSITKNSSPLRTFSSFSSFFSARRRALGISAAELARRAAMPAATIERLEKGGFIPSPGQAYRLGLALHLIDPAELGEWTLTLLFQHPQYLLEHLGAGSA